MTATTPRYAIPYPQGTDRVMDGENAMQAIAERVEAILGPMDDRSSLVPSGFRNLIRNGDIGVAQRGFGPFSANGVYTADGWLKSGIGGTYALDVVSVLGLSAGANGAKNALRATVSGQSAAADYAQLIHKCEGVQTLAGRQAVLSFVAYAASGTPKISAEFAQYFGTGGSPGVGVNTAGPAVTISTTPTRYTIPVTLPGIGGKALGSNANDSLTVNLWLSAGTDYAARASGIGIQNAVITVTDVQLEAGPTATPFERLPLQQQLAWCQRYFFTWAAGPTGTSRICTGLFWNNVNFVGVVEMPVVMRAAPTLTIPNPIGAYGMLIANNVGLTSMALDGATPSSVSLGAVIPAGNATAGNAGAMYGVVGSFLQFSAEL
jgi:hypothetical protein